MKSSKKAIAFVRANNENEDNQSESLQSQLAAIEQYANNNDIRIETVVDSAATDTRSKLTEALTYCKANPEVSLLLVRGLSRISRDFTEFTSWRTLFAAQNVQISSVDDTAAGLFMEAMTFMAGRFDSEARSRIVKERMLERTKNGYSVHRPPLGYSHTQAKGVYRQTNTAFALASYFRDTLAGKMTVRELREAISKIYYPEGRLISPSKFKNLVMNPYYSGFVSYNGQLFKGRHVPLLTEAEHKKLKVLLDK